jgi:hypothetical protein
MFVVKLNLFCGVGAGVACSEVEASGDGAGAGVETPARELFLMFFRNLLVSVRSPETKSFCFSSLLLIGLNFPHPTSDLSRESSLGSDVVHTCRLPLLYYWKKIITSLTFPVGCGYVDTCSLLTLCTYLHSVLLVSSTGRSKYQFLYLLLLVPPAELHQIQQTRAPQLP